MAYNYRCSFRQTCGARKTLPKKIERYAKAPLCPSCGADSLQSVNTKEKARNKRRTCRCDGYHFPHHKGTEPWCLHAARGPTQEDNEDRYRSTR